MFCLSVIKEAPCLILSQFSSENYYLHHSYQSSPGHSHTHFVSQEIKFSELCSSKSNACSSHLEEWHIILQDDSHEKHSHEKCQVQMQWLLACPHAQVDALMKIPALLVLCYFLHCSGLCRLSLASQKSLRVISPAKLRIFYQQAALNDISKPIKQKIWCIK